MEKIKVYSRKDKKEEIHGITLIALVVTIIVLLILAGIAITMLSGDNGILTRTAEARNKSAVKSLKEQVQMVITARQINTNTRIANKQLKEHLENELNNADIEEIQIADGENTYSDVYYVKNGTDYVTVWEDGDVQEGKAEIWDGKKVSCPEFKKENDIWNWYIYTPSQLKFLADFVNNGCSLTGDVNLTSLVEDAGYNLEDVTSGHAYLMNNIDMGARESSGETVEEKWETVENKKVQWTPIGKEIVYSGLGKAFSKTFVGNNHTIKGIYVDESSSDNGWAGIFSGSTGCVFNLNVKDSYIKGKTAVGGIATLVSYYLRNCNNINTVVIATGDVAGGLVGVAWGEVTECSNSGTVISNRESGGIIGERNTGNTELKKCTNTGTIIAKSNGIAGGIIARSLHAPIKISDCTNAGNIVGDGSYMIGGIVGVISDISMELIRCTNQGKISGKNYIGGIVGGAYEDNNPTITFTECSNSGEIEGTGSEIGGIIGAAGIVNINKCSNNGTITGGNQYIGGIGGWIRNGTISECTNNGAITGGNQYIGGIAGGIIDSGTISKCTNNGTITGKQDVGGIAGKTNSVTITDCRDDGIVRIIE